MADEASTGVLDKVTTKKNRIIALDVLRGLAVLGILIPNISAFGLPYEWIGEIGKTAESSDQRYR